MIKIKKRWLMLSIATFSPIIFTASCSFINARKNQKFDYTDSKILKGKIIKFKKSFDFYRNFKTAGIIQSVADFDNFVDNINLTLSHELSDNRKASDILNSQKRFVSLFKDKYNKKFFETKNVIFYQGRQLRVDFLDSVIEKNSQIYLNYIGVDTLNSHVSDASKIPLGIGPENKIYFVEILKQRDFIHINVNDIKTLGEFKDLKNKNFYEGYGVNASKEENKNNYEYEDL